MAAYTTSPVGKRSFRILKLHGSSSAQSPLECDLVETSLDAPQLDYEAVSYCWAGQQPTQPVYVGGKEVKMTKNVEAVLRRFRPTQKDKIRRLWIDSLCINQEDMQERSHQVGLMGDIYSKADQVLIWLRNESAPDRGSRGRGPDYYSACFGWIVRVANAMEDPDMDRRTRDLLTLIREARSQDLLDFVNRIPWFKRVWVIQEAALARKAVLCYDDATATLGSLFEAIDEYGRMEQSGLLGADTIHNPLWNALAVHRMAKTCLKWRSLPRETHEFELHNFLAEMRWSKATEVKDKAYSLHGLLEASGVSMPPPDYSKPVSDIYREATIAIIQSTKSLKIMEQIDGLGTMAGMSSWVPDWSSSKHSIGMLGHFTSVLTTPPPYFRFRQNGKHVVLKGRVIDKVTSRCELSVAHEDEGLGTPETYFTWSKNSQPPEPFWKTMLEANPKHKSAVLFFWNLRVLREFVQFGVGPDPMAASDESVLELYYTMMTHWSRPEDVHTDCAGARQWFSILSGQHNADAQDTEPHADGQWRSKAIQTIRETPGLTELTKTPEYGVYERVSQSNICRTFQDRIARIRYKTLFKSASGKLALAPYSIRSGDDIILFAGIKLPMVARRVGGEYKLIAHAHEKGIGEDAVWRHRPGRDLEFEEITLI